MHHTSIVTTLLIPLLAHAAQPPCLLAAVNTQPNPADSASICASSASKVQQAIQAVCGADQQAALDAFAETCKGDGVIVAQVAPVDSSKSGSTGNNGFSLPPDVNPDSIGTTSPLATGGILTAPAETSSGTETAGGTAGGTKVSGSPSASASSQGGRATSSVVTGGGSSTASSSQSSSPKATGKSGAGRREIGAGSVVSLIVAAAGVVLFL